MNILIVLVASAASAVLYRMGGSGVYPRQSRELGVPLVATIVCFLLGVHNPILLLLAMGFTAASVSTYWDFVGPKEGNLWLHGFMLGFSALPIAYSTGHWWLFVLRSVLLAVFMGGLNRLATNTSWVKHKDILEECGRGAAIVLSLPLLFL